MGLYHVCLISRHAVSGAFDRTRFVLTARSPSGAVRQALRRADRNQDGPPHGRWMLREVHVSLGPFPPSA